jgi:hypothetical protein
MADHRDPLPHAIHLELYRAAFEMWRRYPSLTAEELVEVCGLPPLWGAPQPGRWFGGGVFQDVYGVCDRCYTIYPARDLKIIRKPFSDDDIRVCRECQ